MTPSRLWANGCSASVQQRQLELAPCFNADAIGPAQVVVQTDDPSVVALRKSLGRDLVMFAFSVNADEQSLVTLRYWLGTTLSWLVSS
jgi:hypothetical protein